MNRRVSAAKVVICAGKTKIFHLFSRLVWWHCRHSIKEKQVGEILVRPVFFVSFFLLACADAADAVLVDAECLGTAFVKDAAHTVVDELAAL